MNISKFLSALPKAFRRHKLVQFLIWLSPESRIQIIKFNGNAKLFANLADANPRTYLFNASFEPEFFNISKPFLSRGGVFFDVGANWGFCSFGIIEDLKYLNIEYHLFEANIDIFQTLLKSANLYEGVEIKINHCCVSDTIGISKLKIDLNNMGASFICNDGDKEVKNLVLDDYISQHSINKITFMKLDIEGFEPLALKGAIKSLSHGIIETIYIEISSMNLARLGFKAEECFSLLKNSGYHLFYCKHSDIESKTFNRNKTFKLNINGESLLVVKLDDFPFPSNHQTDILAIHKTSQFLNAYS
jgi:FkbM family methyltransferase